jgi:cation:H+ antiporter
VLWTIVQLVVFLVAILGAAVLFTNAVEILGERLNLGGGAVGSVLAAVGTALPETMIPLVAIVSSLISGSSGTNQISIGAIIGAPFLLMTLGMFVVGVSAWGFRRRRETGTEISVHKEVTRRDLGYFLPFFFVAGAAGFLPLPFLVEVGLVAVLLGAYAYYVWRTIKGSGEGEVDSPDNLLLWPSEWGVPPTWAALAQLVVPIVIMAAGAHYFVQSVEHISQTIGVTAGFIALILAPVATELPEKFNSVYWLRDNKDPIAVGNISGATVFQSTVPVSLGLLFTPWTLDLLAGLAVGLALVAGSALFLMVRSQKALRGTWLVGGGLLYAAFVAAAIATILVQ